MPRNKQKDPAPTFDYGSLPENDAVRLRRHAARIERRNLRRRQMWMGDGYDLFRVREIVAGIRFEAWLKAETPFSTRTAYNLADAAKMLFDAAGSAKFAELPAIKPSVAYLLAAGTTPPEVREKYLPRLIEGVEVTLKEVRADLPKPEASEPEPEDKTVLPPMREPNREVMALVRGLRRPEQELIRKLAAEGSLDMLVRALDALEFESGGRPRPSDATADRLADHAAEAIRETLVVALPTPVPGEDDDDEDEPPTSH